jgi:hypothetical protein
MLLTLRRYLLVLLSLLQFVAPLVHAHSGNNFARFGLHLPNLEVYGVADYQNSPAFQSLDYLADLNDAIVSISTGIQNQQNNADDLSSLLYFPPYAVAITPTLTSCEINFSPQETRTFKTILHTPQSPRAPPFPF